MDRLYYYSRNEGILRETAVVKETAQTYMVGQNTVYATRIAKNDGLPMRNGDAFFFTERGAAVAHLRNYCKYKVSELREWEGRLAELEGIG